MRHLQENYEKIDVQQTWIFDDREFAICESCLWTATSFKMKNGMRFVTDVCPLCSSSNLQFIPLGKGESYRFSITPRRGLEIEFWITQE